MFEDKDTINKVFDPKCELFIYPVKCVRMLGKKEPFLLIAFNSSQKECSCKYLVKIFTSGGGKVYEGEHAFFNIQKGKNADKDIFRY